MKDSTRLVSFRSDSDDGWSTPECINGSRFMSRGACLFPFIGAREPPKIHSLLLINAPNRYFMRNKYDVRGPLRGPSLSKRKLWNKYLSLSLSLSLFSSFFSLSCLKRNSFGEHFAKSWLFYHLHTGWLRTPIARVPFHFSGCKFSCQLGEET